VTLLGLIIVLIVVGVVLWAVQQIPMDPAIRNILRVVVILLVVLWLVFGLLGHPAISHLNPRLW